MPAQHLAALAPGCYNGAGFLTFSADAALPGEVYAYDLTGAATGPAPAGSFTTADLPFTLFGLADDAYTVTVTPAGGTPDVQQVGINCAAPLPLRLGNLRPTAPTTAGGTGSLLVDVTGTNGRLFDLYVYRAQAPGQAAALVASFVNQNAPLNFPVPGLPSDTYTLQAYAGPDSATQLAVIGPFVPAPRGGCTDPRATNTDALATFDDGSCAYTPPPVPAPVFEVAPLTPLRFVQVETVDGCATFVTPDNTLFCQQQRPGQQRRPLFYQPVAFCDPVAVQVLTNYDAVEAQLHHHATGQVLGPAQPLTRALVLDGPAPFAAVELSSSGDGHTYLISATGGLPASLLAAARVQLRLAPGGPALWYRVLASGRASATVTDDYLVLNRPWAAPPPGSFPAVSWPLVGPGFNVWEGLLDLSGAAEGEAVEVRLHGTDAANHSATAISEPLLLAAAHPGTVVLEYTSRDNAYGTVFSTGFAGRLRVPGTGFRQKNGGTTTEHRNSDNTPVLLASTATRLRTLETYQLPAWLHEKLYLVCRLDTLRVDGVAVHGGAAYETTEVRAYPLSSGRVELEQVQWLGAGNGDDSGPNDTGEDFLVLRTGGFLKLRR